MRYLGHTKPRLMDKKKSDMNEKLQNFETWNLFHQVHPKLANTLHNHTFKKV